MTTMSLCFVYSRRRRCHRVKQEKSVLIQKNKKSCIKTGDGNEPHNSLRSFQPFRVKISSFTHRAPLVVHLEAISDLWGLCGADGPSLRPRGPT